MPMKGFLFFVSIFSFLSIPVSAHCPLCTAATGALVASARIAGMDDAVSGTFIGAFAISTAFWSHRIIVRRLEKQIAFQPYVLSVIFFSLTIIGFYFTDLLGTMPDAFRILGMERLVFGLVLGSIVSIVAFEVHNILRKLNKNRNYFPLQGIVLPLVFLAVADAALYLSGVI